MIDVLAEITRRKVVRNQAIERALKPYFRKALGESFVNVDAGCTHLDGIWVKVTTLHDSPPIADLTGTVQQGYYYT